MSSLFLLYVNDLCNVSTRLTSILFADDTSCFIEGTDLSDMCIQLSTEMNKLSTWFKTNRLSLNVSKTNCMIFGRSNQPDHHRVYINNIVIERVNCNKFLGVIQSQIQDFPKEGARFRVKCHVDAIQWGGG